MHKKDSSQLALGHSHDEARVFEPPQGGHCGLGSNLVALHTEEQGGLDCKQGRMYVKINYVQVCKKEVVESYMTLAAHALA